MFRLVPPGQKPEPGEIRKAVVPVKAASAAEGVVSVAVETPAAAVSKALKEDRQGSAEQPPAVCVDTVLPVFEKGGLPHQKGNGKKHRKENKRAWAHDPPPSILELRSYPKLKHKKRELKINCLYMQIFGTKKQQYYFRYHYLY
jgi:hypothetical protein